MYILLSTYNFFLKASPRLLMHLLILVYLGDPQITDPLATESVITTRLWCILMNREASTAASVVLLELGGSPSPPLRSHLPTHIFFGVPFSYFMSIFIKIEKLGVKWELRYCSFYNWPNLDLPTALQQANDKLFSICYNTFSSMTTLVDHSQAQSQ